jgi:hypothetical protein
LFDPAFRSNNGITLALGSNEQKKSKSAILLGVYRERSRSIQDKIPDVDSFDSGQATRESSMVHKRYD